MDCLNRHDYDRDKCLDFFQAYRDCKKAWVCVVRLRFATDIHTGKHRWSSDEQTVKQVDDDVPLGPSHNVSRLYLVYHVCVTYK